MSDRGSATSNRVRMAFIWGVLFSQSIAGIFGLLILAWIALALAAANLAAYYALRFRRKA